MSELSRNEGRAPRNLARAVQPAGTSSGTPLAIRGRMRLPPTRDVSKDSASRARPDGDDLLGVGALLFVMSLVNGFAISSFPLRRLALSAHLVGLLGAAFLFALGAAWSRFGLARARGRLAAVLAIYGFCGGWLLYLLAAATKVAGRFPMASGGVRGTPFAEALVNAALLSVAVSLFVLAVLLLGALRGDRHHDRT